MGYCYDPLPVVTSSFSRVNLTLIRMSFNNNQKFKKTLLARITRSPIIGPEPRDFCFGLIMTATKCVTLIDNGLFFKKNVTFVLMNSFQPTSVSIEKNKLHCF